MISIKQIPTNLILLSAVLTLFLASCGGDDNGDGPPTGNGTEVEIVAFSPDSAFVGDEVQIQGLGFSPEQSENQVFFGGDAEATVDSVSLTEGNDSGTLITTVPDGAADGPIAVSVNGGERAESGADFNVIEAEQQEEGEEFARLYWSARLQQSTGSYVGGLIGTSYTNDEGRRFSEILYNTNNFPLSADNSSIYGFALDLNSEQIYWADSGSNGSSPVIARASLEANNATVDTLYQQSDGLGLPVYVVLDLEADMLYWADGGLGIRKAPLDGSGPIETVYDTDINTAIGIDMLLDSENNMLYWTELGDSQVVRAPKDGSGPVEVLFESSDASPPLGSGGTTFDMLADPEDGYIYISDGESPDGRILRGAIDGSGTLQTLYSGDEDYLSVPSLALDQPRGFLYWGQTAGMWNGNGGVIVRAPADGSGEVETVYDLRGIHSDYRSVNFIYGLAVAPDQSSAKAKGRSHIPPIYLKF